MTHPDKQPTPLDTYLQTRRDALYVELRWIEKQLGIVPQERVICPVCRKERRMDRDKHQAA